MGLRKLILSGVDDVPREYAGTISADQRLPHSVIRTISPCRPNGTRLLHTTAGFVSLLVWVLGARARADPRSAPSHTYVTIILHAPVPS